MLHLSLLGAHVLAGTVGLLVAPVAMLAPKRRRRSLHRPLGYVYQGATALLAFTAVGLSLFDFGDLAYLAVIAVATEAAALGGWWAIRRRPTKRILHLNLLCGSYISFATAFLVVQWSSPFAWALPTIVGSPLIAWATRREAARLSEQQNRQGPSASRKPDAEVVTN